MQGLKHDDQSDFLIHLVGKNDPYNTFMSVLSSGIVESKNAFGFQRKLHNKKSICFSEIPPLYLQKLVSKRYNYGIAFKKELLLDKGAQRVWYVEKDSEVHSSITNISNHLNGEMKDSFFNLAPFIDIAGEYENSTYRFEWEREWRIVGNLSFTPDDVEFLILPSDVHELARDFFTDAETEQTGPNYDCPYYDPITGSCSKKT